MKKILNIEIDAGNFTCANEKNRFCDFLSTHTFGTVWFCHLFSVDTDRKGKPQGLPRHEDDRLQQRHKNCLLAEVQQALTSSQIAQLQKLRAEKDK